MNHHTHEELVQIKVPEKQRLWDERIEDFLSSGQTQKAWCEDYGIPGNQLSYWLRKHRSKNDERSTNRWVSLPTSQTTCSGVSLRLGKAVLEVEPGFDEQTLAALLRALMAAC